MSHRYVPNDKWSQRAAAEGFRARSVYKLQEMDEKFRLIRKNQTVLDLGACPGSWLQYTSQKIGPRGLAIGVDLTAMEPIDENVHLYQEDITNLETIADILDGLSLDEVDLILSDLAPKTSGVKDIDQWRSIELSHSVIHVAEKFLKSGGKCVMKVLRGSDFDEFIADCKKSWQNVKVFNAKASRDRSTEVYVLLTKL